MSNSGFSDMSDGAAGFQSAVSAAYFPYEVTRIGAPDAFRYEVATGRIGPLHLSRTYVSGSFRGHRRVTNRGDERRAYVLMLLEEGKVRLQGKHSAISETGDLVLINANRPMESEQCAGGISLAVSIPANLLEARFLDVDNWCLRSINSGHGSPAILRESLLCYWRASSKLRPTECGDLAASLIHLVGAVFRDCSQVPMFTSHSMGLHFLRVRDLVATHLDSEDLSADFVSDNLGISKSYLFMIMNTANTTLGRFILEQRLERSRELLADPAAMYRQISDIAFSVGFQDLSHFSRRFTERYGRSPRAFRAKACAPMSESPAD